MHQTPLYYTIFRTFFHISPAIPYHRILQNAVVTTDSILPRKYAAGHCLQTMVKASSQDGDLGNLYYFAKDKCTIKDEIVVARGGGRRASAHYG